MITINVTQVDHDGMFGKETPTSVNIEFMGIGKTGERLFNVVTPDKEKMTMYLFGGCSNKLIPAHPPERNERGAVTNWRTFEFPPKDGKTLLSWSEGYFRDWEKDKSTSFFRGPGEYTPSGKLLVSTWSDWMYSLGEHLHDSPRGFGEYGFFGARRRKEDNPVNISSEEEFHELLSMG